MGQDTARDADVRDHLVAIDDIELRSGLELFPAFTTAQQNAIETDPLTPAEWDAMVPTRGCVSVRYVQAVSESSVVLRTLAEYQAFTLL